MARIGSTFTADQQFESFTQPSSSDFAPHPARPPHNIRNCVRRTGGIVRVEAIGAVGAQAAERAEPERDESPLGIDMVDDGRWRRGFVQRASRCQRAACPIKSIPPATEQGLRRGECTSRLDDNGIQST
jgi:hypothetical protein